MSSFIRTLKDTLGNQILPRTKTSAVSLSDGSSLNSYEDNIRGGGGIRPQIVVTAPSGSTITCTDGTTTQTGLADVNNTCIFYIPHFGSYTVSAVLAHQTAPIKTIMVDTVTIYHVTLVYFRSTITVTAPTGSALTCISGTTILSGTSDGSYVFTITTPGVWTVTATLGGNTATKIINVADTSNTDYPVVLNYYMVYGVRIDTTNSNPLTSVSYIEGTDSYGMVKGSANWDTMPVFNTIKPCVLKDGNVVTYLNPNNFGQRADGTPITIDENVGDVMIEFGKGGYKFVTNGNYLDLYVTNNPNGQSEGYSYHPFSHAEEGDCEHFWLGAYTGSAVYGRLCSLSGRSIGYYNLAEYRSYASANGAGYTIQYYYQYMWLQILYLVRFGNLDARVALGMGYRNNNAVPLATGSLDTSGMTAGSPSNSITRVKLFGVEDVYGNILTYVDGFSYKDSPEYSLCMTYPGYGSPNLLGEGYKYSIPSGIQAIRGEYLTSVQGTNETGFLPKAGGGTESTYYTDIVNLIANRVYAIGGTGENQSAIGMFYLENFTDNSTTNSYQYIATRLMYCYQGK